ncbi:PREDICTED: protodermal factor [Prunus dulcis]|uniref:PREDICTED: protodermal factor n=1 Tax=Prunus dulcis TaxID=3755 RepID=A0A5E4FF49_PRUDU|nr:PREDICTED: protodermal factor [Prunus dulcis]
MLKRRAVGAGIYRRENELRRGHGQLAIYAATSGGVSRQYCCLVLNLIRTWPFGEVEFMGLGIRTRAHLTLRACYWGSRREAWPRMVPQTSTVSKVFGSRAYERYRSDLTLLEATVRNDEENVYPRLLKQASAALLNSYARKGFPYSAWEVKTLVIQALVSDKAAALQAQRFSVANEACH